jgi:hypothetical protein
LGHGISNPYNGRNNLILERMVFMKKEKGIVYFVRTEYGFGSRVYISDVYTNIDDAREEYNKRVQTVENREVNSIKEEINEFMTIFWPKMGTNYNAKIRIDCRSLY